MGLFTNNEKWGGSGYPPQTWTCPQCGKSHSKSHFRRPGQMPIYGYNPQGGLGKERMKDVCMNNPDKDQPIDLETSLVKPLFCPHCFYEENPRIVLIIDGYESRKYIA